MLIDLKVIVYWADGEIDPDDEINQEAFAKVIKQYIMLFRSLPPIGLFFNGGTCDEGKVTEIMFDEDNTVWIELSF